MDKQIIRQIDEHLILRRSMQADAQDVAQFNKEIHGEGKWDEIGLVDWTLDLLSGDGPTFSPDDFTLVEDTSTGKIVSACCLISQTWAYEGIPFKVGRPELVGTHKDFRRKGLIRQQFDILHEWSKKRGELVQVITGIPYYYRQFEYEMTLNLGGGRAGYKAHVPELKEDETEPYTFRLAEEGDIPFLMETYQRGSSRSMVYALWDEAQWRYELLGKRKYNINRRMIYVILDQSGKLAGFIGIPPHKWGKSMMLTLYEIAEGFAWTDITPSVIRFLWQTGVRLGEDQDQPQQIFGFWLGEQHPAYDVIDTLLPRKRQPYTYYVRVPDLPAFLNLVKPVLEARLAESSFINYTGELKISFYRDGIQLKFNQGRLETIDPLRFDEIEGCAANFPPLTFLHLVFGHRSMAELKQAFTDCTTEKDETMHLLDALFPKKPSSIWDIA